MADWSNWPMNKVVNWPKGEKIIGVLGLGPIATADFYSKLVSRNMNKDWQYPRVLLDVHSKIPSRGRYFSLGETDPAPFIRNAIEELHLRGADFVVIPCNTAHILYDRFAHGVSVPVPNIVDITTISALKCGIQHPLILSTSTTRDHLIYEDAFGRHGVKAVQFPEQHLVSEGIEAIKQNLPFSDIAQSICRIINSSLHIDSVIFGCTEVSVLMKCMAAKGNNKYPCIDSNQELADFCLHFAMNESIDDRIRTFA